MMAAFAPHLQALDKDIEQKLREIDPEVLETASKTQDQTLHVTDSHIMQSLAAWYTPLSPGLMDPAHLLPLATEDPILRLMLTDFAYSERRIMLNTFDRLQRNQALTELQSRFG